MVGWHHRLNGHGFGWTLGVGDVQEGLACCSSWGCEESDMTEQLQFHFSLSCIGEGNGNPLHRSCLENPRDGGAWWAAVYGVTQSRTRLKRLSSSSNLHKIEQQEKPEYQLRNACIDSKTVRKNKQIVITKIRLMILRKRMEL